MTDTPLSDDVLDAAMRAFGDTEIVGGPPSFTRRAMANAIRAALEAARYGEMVEALTQLATTEQDSLEHALAIGQARALLSSIGASRP